MNQIKLDKVSEILQEEKIKLKSILPTHLQDEFMRESYISGGCIYSLYNDNEPKDYDFFVKSELFANKVTSFFMSLLTPYKRIELISGASKIKITHYKGHRVVLSKNAISIGKYQIITKFVGEPEKVVREFDFMHNTYWHDDDGIHAWNQWDFLDSTKLIYNEDRARDISGTIIRAHKFVERGMKMSNSEMAKMLRKLRDVGFTERENEIIENTASY